MERRKLDCGTNREGMAGFRLQPLSPKKDWRPEDTAMCITFPRGRAACSKCTATGAPNSVPEKPGFFRRSFRDGGLAKTVAAKRRFRGRAGRGPSRPGRRGRPVIRKFPMRINPYFLDLVKKKGAPFSGRWCRIRSNSPTPTGWRIRWPRKSTAPFPT